MMSNWFNPFNNRAPAIYIIGGFIVAVVLFLSCEARAETRIEWGATFAEAEYSGGAAIFFSETWDDKYLLGFGLVGDQAVDDAPVKSNMVVIAQRLVTYKRVTLGFGVANWQHQSRLLGDEFTFSLSLGVELRDNWYLQWRHFSNGGTAKPNAGQDLLMLGYRFK